MTKKMILEKLVSNYKNFTDFIVLMDDIDFVYGPAEKWTAGQQLDHIIRAVAPLANGLLLPKFMIRIIFGKAKRSSKTYEELVNGYLAKLKKGGKATGLFIPVMIYPSQKHKRAEKLLSLVARLERNLNCYSESQLDSFLLPHPLLGKITLREMMYFTIYHTEHHLKQVKRNIAV